MTQQRIAVLTRAITASGAVLEGRAVGFDGSQAAIRGQKVMGVAVTDASSGEALFVVTHGTAVMETGAAVSIGDSVMVDADGKVVPASGGIGVTSSVANGTDLPEFVFADALQAASAAGEFIEVLLRR